MLFVNSIHLSLRYTHKTRFYLRGSDVNSVSKFNHRVCQQHEGLLLAHSTGVCMCVSTKPCTCVCPKNRRKGKNTSERQNERQTHR